MVHHKTIWERQNIFEKLRPTAPFEEINVLAINKREANRISKELKKQGYKTKIVKFKPKTKFGKLEKYLSEAKYEVLKLSKKWKVK